MVNYYTQFLSTFKFPIKFVSLMGIDVTNFWEFAHTYHFDMTHKNSFSQEKKMKSDVKLDVEVKIPRH